MPTGDDKRFVWAEPAIRTPLTERDHEAEQPGAEQRRAREVKRTGLACALRLGNAPPAPDDHQQHHGDVEEKRPTPRPFLSEKTTEEWADRKSDAQRGSQHAERDSTVSRFGEHHVDEGNGGREQHGIRDALQETRQDQDFSVPADSTEETTGNHHGRTDEQHAPPAPAVGELPHGDEKRGREGEVNRDGHLRGALLDVQIPHDIGKLNGKHRDPDEEGQLHQHQECQSDEWVRRVLSGSHGCCREQGD